MRFPLQSTELLNIKVFIVLKDSAFYFHDMRSCWQTHVRFLLNTFYWMRMTAAATESASACLEHHHESPKSLLWSPSPDLRRDGGAEKVLVWPAERSRGRSSALCSFLFGIKNKRTIRELCGCDWSCCSDIWRLSSVVVHRWSDGHTPPDLPPSNQTDNEEKETQRAHLFHKLETQSLLNTEM